MKYFRLTKLSIVIAVTAYLAPAEAQIVKKEPDAIQLSCGKKLLVDNNTYPANEILQVTGSCLNWISANDICALREQHNATSNPKRENFGHVLIGARI
jgi:hypothetical protein